MNCSRIASMVLREEHIFRMDLNSSFEEESGKSTNCRPTFSITQYTFIN